MDAMKVAIVLPAYNEELTIAATMKDFFGVLPDAEIYVVDNASTDKTSEIAQKTYDELRCKGCLMYEGRKGKAAAVRKAFHDIDADIYVMADADLTYPAKDLPALLEPVLGKRADIVCGNRHFSGKYQSENKRLFHNLGNTLVRKLINWLFKGNLQDILTGYRVMSKRFVKNYPILSTGFALETEMSIHALDKGYTLLELPTDYRDRPQGSFSKLDTFQDGLLVLQTIVTVFIRFRPLIFFTFIAFLFGFAALFCGWFPVIEYWQTGKILRFPLAILATGLSVMALLSFSIGIILDAIAAQQRFMHALSQLNWSDTHNESASRRTEA